MKKLMPVFSFVLLSMFIVLFSYHALQSGQKIFNTFFAFADAEQLIIYDDKLAPGYSDWSWGGTREFQSTEQVQNGSNAVRFTPAPWSGFYLHTDNQIDANLYESLQFSVRGTADGQKLSVVLYDNNNQAIGNFRPLGEFGGDVPNGSWKTYTIPLSVLNPSNLPMKGLALQEVTGHNQAPFFFDDIFFKGKVLPTVTQPPAESSPTPTLPPASPSAALKDIKTKSLSVYHDSLAQGFVNWSWESTISLSETAKVYEGSRAIAFTPRTGWAGLYLHTTSPITTTEYQYLEMAVQGTQTAQKFSVILHDAQNNLIGSPVLLEKYGVIPSGVWKRYLIPLSDLQADGKRITGVIIQERSGSAQPTLFVDSISFSSYGTPGTALPVAPTTTSSFSPAATGNPFAGRTLYLKSENNAKQTADSWRAAGRSADADQLMKVANQPTARWLVGNDTSAAQETLSQAEAEGKMSVLVAYNLPGRDCGQYSQGGTDYEGYKAWITQLAGVIGSRKAAVILEPDALGLDCLQNETTYSLLRFAIDTLTRNPGTAVYIEASTWVTPETMAERMGKAGAQKAQGFAINTSGYKTTESMIAYGTSLSSKVGGKHFVIDTSRNGNGPYDSSQPEAWCNPPDRALGQNPTTATGNGLVDAYLWVKVPGESDGTCRGGPGAGQWWPEYALGLAQRAK